MSHTPIRVCLFLPRLWYISVYRATPSEGLGPCLDTPSLRRCRGGARRAKRPGAKRFSSCQGRTKSCNPPSTRQRDRVARWPVRKKFKVADLHRICVWSNLDLATLTQVRNHNSAALLPTSTRAPCCYALICVVSTKCMISKGFRALDAVLCPKEPVRFERICAESNTF